MEVEISKVLRESFPDLNVLLFGIRGIRVERENLELEEFKKELIKRVGERYDLETLKDQHILRAYRNFYWRVGIDPTKIRPAAEALIRRILAGKTLPKINTLVDAYNLASIDTNISIAAFDEEKLEGGLSMRFSGKGEEFLGIGMEKPMILGGNEVVVTDREKLLAVYPHRDADITKVALSTKKVLILICGVPGISTPTLRRAEGVVFDYVTRFCQGEYVP